MSLHNWAGPLSPHYIKKSVAFHFYINLLKLLSFWDFFSLNFYLGIVLQQILFSNSERIFRRVETGMTIFFTLSSKMVAVNFTNCKDT